MKKNGWFSAGAAWCTNMTEKCNLHSISNQRLLCFTNDAILSVREQSKHPYREISCAFSRSVNVVDIFYKKRYLSLGFFGRGGCKSAFSKAPKREKSVINSILRSHIDIVSHLSVSLWRARPAGAGSHALSFLPGVCASCAQRWLVSGHGADSCLLFIIYLF